MLIYVERDSSRVGAVRWSEAHAIENAKVTGAAGSFGALTAVMDWQPTVVVMDLRMTGPLSGYDGAAESYSINPTGMNTQERTA